MTDKSPTIYDTFYYDYFILTKVLEQTNFDDFLNKCGMSSSKSSLLRGYVYFSGVLIVNIIDHMERLTRAFDTYEYIAWGRGTLGGSAAHKLSKYDKNIKYVFKLRDEIKGLMKILHSKIISEKEVSEQVNKLKLTLKSAKKQIDTTYKPVKVIGNETAFRHSVLRWLINNYGYYKNQYQPGTLFYSLMTNESARSFWLGIENKNLFPHRTEIILGYKYCIMYLCDYLSPSAYSSIKNEFDNASDLEALRQACIKLGELTNCECVKIFKIRRVSMRRATSIKVAKDNGDMELLFRNRPISLIRTTEFMGYKRAYELDEATEILRRLILGYVWDSSLRNQKVELIRFEHEDPIYRTKKDYAYSYAIYIPMFGSLGISNGSYWIVFDSIALFNKGGYQSDTKRLLDRLIEVYKRNISLISVKTSYSLLKAYTTERYLDTILIKELIERLQLSLGLSTEFLACTFILKRHKANLLALHRAFNKTDLDVLAENNSTVFLVQAKTTMSLKIKNLEKDIGDVLTFFKSLDYTKIRKDYNIAASKEIKKYLFVMGFTYDVDIGDSEEDEDEPSEAELIFSRRLGIRNALNKEDIQVVFFDQLKTMNDIDGGYEDLSKKIKDAFNIEDNHLIF